MLVGPSARYLDDEGYVGGFSRSDIDDLLETMDSNHLGWQDPLSGLVMANAERPELKQELEAAFCRNRPDIARHFAGVTFLGDNRDDLAGVTIPTLVVQTRHDAIAPVTAGQLVHDRIEGSRLVMIEGYGHCPAPQLARRDASRRSATSSARERPCARPLRPGSLRVRRPRRRRTRRGRQRRAAPARRP